MKFWKKHSFSLMILSVSLLFILSGCSKKENNPVVPGDNTPVTGGGSITLNGGGYSNKSLSSPASTAGYIDEYRSTLVSFYVNSGTDTVLTMIIFPGKAAGNFAWKGMVIDDSTSSTYWDGASLSFGHLAYKIYMPLAGGKTTITKYGNVGQFIEGTYSGKIQDPATTAEINVTGSFKALRLE